jgi:uncharacterized membrane protein YhaH (DUF805 family)
MFTAYKRYFDFQGRSNRTEYWLFVLTYIIALVVAAVVDVVAFGGARNIETIGITGPAYGLVILGSLIPALAAGIRRLHDTNRSGWWMLIGLIPLVGALVLLVFYVLPGTPGSNRFGPPAGTPDVQETFA